ncbi:MAG TPA: diguanylate cyclase [Steroidobacteraceae bacterium]|nr:diguanylate cyclase [Steroidobacteraceae bacterium]
MADWSVDFLRKVLDAAPEGIAVCEAQGADHPVIYVNAAFEKLTGYSAAELLGTDMRRLQGTDREQEGRHRLREALARGESCRALLRNYRKDGTQFWNELMIEVVRDEQGAVTRLVSFHRDIAERAATPQLRGEGGLPTWLREDRLSGLFSRAYFEELLQHDWNVGLREGRVLTLLLFDIDELQVYAETFGRPAGDACIRRVAGVIGASFRRGADVVARWEGGCVAALVRNPDQSTLAAFAATVQQRVLGQRIHNPRATRQKFVAVTCGIASLNPVGDRAASLLMLGAQRALSRARTNANNPVAIATPEELEG